MVSGQVVINEACSRNLTTFIDEDQNANDWIELYNKDSININLKNYFLSDKPDNIKKWQFPDVVIPAGSFLTLFASGHNRRDVINHWETIIYASDTWRYLVPEEEPDPEWKELSFVDSTWLEGIAGFGYGDGDDSTIINDTLWSVYIRKAFTIIDTGKIINAVLHADYDDGFVAYLNGVEVVRANMTKDDKVPHFTAPAFSYHEAQMYQGGVPEDFSIKKELLKNVLVNGSNVLTIQAHSRWADGDLSIIPFFSVSLNDSSSFYRDPPEWFYADKLHLHTNFSIKAEGEAIILSDSTGAEVDYFDTPFLQLDISAGRFPDGDTTLRIFLDTSPDSTNNNSLTLLGVTETIPDCSLPGGFYQDSVEFNLVTPDSATCIRYTLDGSMPSDTSSIYSDPIVLNTTTVLRAACFKENYYRGDILTNTYFINDSSNFPIVSVSTDPDNLWDWENGIYVMGPNAQPNWPYFGANFWEDWEIPIHVEYFDENKTIRLDQDAGGKIYGGWTRGLPMKSFRIMGKGKYGLSELSYKFFRDKEINQFKRLILRNAGNDFYSAFMRDALVHKLIQPATDLDIQEYDPVVLFYNGEYFGVHNLREKVGKYYLADNYQIPPEQVIILENQAQVVEGSNHDFLALINFITSHDLSQPEDFSYVASQLDLQNFSDYMITEMFIINTDWPHHNVKCWKTQDTRWRYFFLDVDASQWIFSTNGPSINYLNKIIQDSVNYSSVIFTNLLSNYGYKEYFINRYADLLNTIFSPGHFAAHLDSLKEHLKPEMHRHKDKWGGTVSSWENYHIETKLKGFIQERPNYVREHIVEVFNLEKYDTLTLLTNPPGAAKIKINTIIIDSVPWSGIYFDSIPVTIEVIPYPGYDLSFWQSTDSLSLADSSDVIKYPFVKTDTITAHFVGFPDTADIIFTEINYKSYINKDAGDWIELYNHDNEPVDLGNWKFIDDSDDIFLFPEGTILLAGEYLVLARDTAKFCDVYPELENILGPFIFGLSSQGEQLGLENRYGHLLKSITYGTEFPWPAGASGTGRTIELINYNGDMNNAENWMNGCLCGSPGRTFSTCHDTMKLIVTEINYKSYEGQDAGDWIELFNNDTISVSMPGWVFKDDDNNHSFLFPDSLVIDPGDYLVVVNDIPGFHEIYPEITNYCGQFNFGLGSGGDEVRLFDDFDQQIVYIAYESGAPWPENTNGTGRTLELIDYGGSLNSPLNWKSGCLGGSPAAPSISCHDTSKIIVTEFNYQSSPELDAGDWVEIYNHDTVVVELRGWGFKDESAYHYYEFPSSFALLPGEYLLIVQDTVKFKNIYPDIESYVGPFDFGLSMNGDMIMISDPFGQHIVQIGYEGGYPWPDQANGTGRTVELIDYDGELNNYANWKNGCVGGSPGTEFIPCDTNTVQHLTIDISFISYPNPFSESMFIELELKFPKFIQINLIDQYGRIVSCLQNGMIRPGKNKLHFETGELSPGIYYLHVITGEQMIYRKIVKL